MEHRRIMRPLVRAALQDGVAHKPGRVLFARVRIEEKDGSLVAFSAGSQETGRLKALVDADGIAVIPAEWGSVEPGAAVQIQVLRPK